MKDKNPMNSESIKKDKSWNSNYVDARIGFINRDATTSEAIQAPMVLSPMGRLYANAIRNIDPNRDEYEAASVYGQASWWLNADRLSIPGIMTLEFDPIFGQTSDTASGAEPSYRNFLSGRFNDIFISLYTKMRILNNMTAAWTPGDFHVLSVAGANILMHIAHARRALTVMQTVFSDPTNEYNSAEQLIRAMGWNMNIAGMRTNFVRWRNFFNTSIIGVLNSVPWFKFDNESFPGFRRWESLVSEIYKDTSADTDYTQLYILRPCRFWGLREEPDAQGVYVWQFKEREYAVTAAGNPPETCKVFMEPNEVNATTSAGNVVGGTTVFGYYLEMIAREIQSVFYSDSAADIIATLNAIAQRKMSSDVVSEYFHEPVLDMEPERLKFTWDFKMMLAIHNATIMDAIDHSGAGPDVAYVDGDGNLIQDIYWGREFEWPLLSATKVINLPCYGATNEDFANATQWTIVSGTGVRGLSKAQLGDLGTEIIHRAWILDSSVIAENDVTYVHDAIPFQQRVRIKDANENELVHGMYNADKFDLMLAPSFLFAPILYVTEKSSWGGVETRQGITGVVCQHEVLYGVTESVAAGMHIQWNNNFYGYPVVPATYGTPQFETDKS